MNDEEVNQFIDPVYTDVSWDFVILSSQLFSNMGTPLDNN